MEVKTRVSPEHVVEAKRILSHCNNKIIACIVHTDDIEQVMDREHSIQVMIPMATCKLSWAIYIVG